MFTTTEKWELVAKERLLANVAEMLLLVKATFKRNISRIKSLLKFTWGVERHNDVTLTVLRECVGSCENFSRHLVLEVADHVVQAGSLLCPSFPQAFKYRLDKYPIKCILTLRNSKKWATVGRVRVRDAKWQVKNGELPQFNLELLDLVVREYLVFEVGHYAQLEQMTKVELVEQLLIILLRQYRQLRLIEDRLERFNLPFDQIPILLPLFLVNIEFAFSSQLCCPCCECKITFDQPLVCLHLFRVLNHFVLLLFESHFY